MYIDVCNESCVLIRELKWRLSACVNDGVKMRIKRYVMRKLLNPKLLDNLEYKYKRYKSFKYTK